MTMNIGADDGRMPANVFETVRPTVTAGLAKLVEEVKKYAPPMYAATAKGATDARPVRTTAKMTTTRPNVATTSASHSGPDERVFVDDSKVGRANMALA